MTRGSAARHQHPAVQPRPARQDEPHLLVREIDRHAVEQPQRVHAEQQRRLIGQAEALERLGIGERDGNIVEVRAADLDAIDIARIGR